MGVGHEANAAKLQAQRVQEGFDRRRPLALDGGRAEQLLQRRVVRGRPVQRGQDRRQLHADEVFARAPAKEVPEALIQKLSASARTDVLPSPRIA